jgi:hypothetical protein
MKKQIVDGFGVLIDDQRNDKPGRRTTDAHCPFYPDNCRDILATKEEIKPMKRALEDKLDYKFFQLFLVTFIPIAFLLLGWIGVTIYKSTVIVTRLDVNQQVFLKAFDIKPILKPEGDKK